MAPRFSVVLPVFNTRIPALKRCLSSLLRQEFEDWELCVVNDGSHSRRVSRLLKKAAKNDSRIRLIDREHNLGITKSSQQALSIATGDFVVFLDHDDELEKHALSEFAGELSGDSAIDFVYSDETMVFGKKKVVIYKPDWSPIRLLSQNYISHLVAIRRSLLESVGGVRDGFEGAQDYDIYLRCSAKVHRVTHIRQSLYKWNIHGSSYSQSENTRMAVVESGRRALQEHLNSNELEKFRAERSSIQGAFSIWTKAYRDDPFTVIRVPQPFCANDVLIGDAAPESFALPPSVETLDAISKKISESDSRFVVLCSEELVCHDSVSFPLLLQMLHLRRVAAVAPVMVNSFSQVVSSGHFHRQGMVVRAGFGIPWGNNSVLGPLEMCRDVSSVGWDLVAIDTEAWAMVGGFSRNIDPRLALIDLCLRFREANFSTVVDPRIVLPVSDTYEERVVEVQATRHQQLRERLMYDPFDWVPASKVVLPVGRA